MLSSRIAALCICLIIQRKHSTFLKSAEKRDQYVSSGAWFGYIQSKISSPRRDNLGRCQAVFDRPGLWEGRSREEVKSGRWKTRWRSMCSVGKF